MKKVIGKHDQIYNLAPIKYKYAYQAYLDQVANFWHPRQIQIGKDVSVFRNEMSKAEKHVFTHVFAQLSTMDVLAGDILKDVVAKKITSPEHQLAISMQIGQEAIHADSYQYCADHLGLDESWLWSRYTQVPEINAKIEYSNFIMDKYGKSDKIEDFIIAYWFMAAIFEGTWFLSGFAPIMSMSRNKKINEIPDILMYIARDEDGHRVFGISTIKSILQENHNVDLDYIKLHIEEITIKSVNLESEYIKFIMSEGGILGFNKDEYMSHIKARLNTYLARLNMPSLFKDVELLKWYEDILAMRRETNFFENHVSEYGKVLEWS